MKRIKAFLKSIREGFMYAADCLGYVQPIVKQECNDVIEVDWFGYSVKDNAWTKADEDYKNRQSSRISNDMAIQYAKIEGMRNMNGMLRIMKKKTGFYDVYLCNTQRIDT